MASSRKYSDADVRAIIAHALDSEAPRDVSHEELVSIASEVGLSRESIEKAARELEAGRATDSAKLSVIGRRRRYLTAHAGAFLLVNLFLFAVNYLTTPGEWWVAFPIAIWGLALILHAVAGLSRRVSPRAIAREQKRLERERSTDREARAPGARVRLEVAPELSPEANTPEQEAPAAEATPQRLRNEPH